MKSNRTASQVAFAIIAGVIYGAILGALIAASIGGGDTTGIGALIGAIYCGLAEGITDYLRKPGTSKPMWHRIVGMVLLMAATGAVIGAVLGSVVASLILGLLIGMMGFSVRNLQMGIVVGSAGAVAASITTINPAVLGGIITLVHQLALRVFFEQSEPFEVMGEKVPPEDARYVVPFEARTKYIGTAFMQELAQQREATFQRNRPGIGLMDTLESLHGPQFDPDKVDARIRDFYEHTSNYKLTIIPEWKPYIRPFFWLFKTYLAQPIGQANLPFNTDEAQLGVISYIDSIDYTHSDSDEIETLRAWIRAFEATGEAIYVGIYTVVQHDGAGYVSVGFPLPESNFTATLLPHNHNGGGLLLKTNNPGNRFTGHYISDIDNDTGAITAVKVALMDEEIEVFVEDGDLKTDHRFYLGRFKFLTLHYSIALNA